MPRIEERGYGRYLVSLSRGGKVVELVWCESAVDAWVLALGRRRECCVEILDLTEMDEASGYAEFEAAQEAYKDYPCAVWCVDTRRAYKSDSAAQQATGETRYYVKQSCRTGKPSPSGRRWRKLNGE